MFKYPKGFRSSSWFTISNILEYHSNSSVYVLYTHCSWCIISRVNQYQRHLTYILYIPKFMQHVMCAVTWLPFTRGNKFFLLKWNKMKNKREKNLFEIIGKATLESNKILNLFTEFSIKSFSLILNYGTILHLFIILIPLNNPQNNLMQIM